MSTSAGITDGMIARLQEALAHADSQDALVPIESMAGYFVSREHRGETCDGNTYLFPVEISAQTVYVYLRI